MKLFTYSDARQRLATVLETATREGKVLIRRRDGSLFSLTPEMLSASPLDVEGIDTQVTTAEIVETLRAERERSRPNTGRRKRLD